jgi:hypothetical protein
VANIKRELKGRGRMELGAENNELSRRIRRNMDVITAELRQIQKEI